jgi:hypothetical protein
MNFSDVLSISSIYLALIGLLSTFFFINLTQWISSIKGLKLKWDKLFNQNEPQKTYEQRLDCYKEANQYSSNWTLISWLIVTAFLIITFIFQVILIACQDDTNRQNLLIYLFTPSLIFLIIYLGFSILILVNGYKLANKIVKEFI